jgi:hypothetical protein
MSPYDHAYGHALDFVLFDHAPRFDFRHEAWGLLPKDLQEAVREKTSQWMANRNGPLSETAKRKISETRRAKGCGIGNQHARGNSYSLTDEQKENRRRAALARPTLECPVCGRECKGAAGLANHLKSHKDF